MEVLSADNKIMTVNGKLAKAPSITGTGDMKKSVYDPTGIVEQAGGIPDYVANNAPVTSVNNKTGPVTLTKADVGLSQVDNVKQYSAQNPPPYPVTSVNGQTGAVILSASDIGAQSTITVNGILKGDGAGGVTAAEAGTDYADVFIIDCMADGTYDESMPIPVTPSKTYDEVRNAILGQKQCYAQYDGIYYPLTKVSINAAESNNIVNAVFTVARAGVVIRSIEMRRITSDTDPVWSIRPAESALRAPESATKGQVMAYQGGIRGWRNSAIGTNLSTTFSGLIKGSDGYLAQATPGVDYEEAPFTIHFTTDNLDENIISSDKSGAQIESAFNAGFRVEAFLDGKQLGSANTISNGRGYDFVDITANGNIRGVRLSIEDGDMSSGGGKTYSFLPVDFSCVERPALSGTNELWGTDTDGFWGLISNIALSNLPAVSAADNGKFLRVVNGAWAIVAIDNANGGSF